MPLVGTLNFARKFGEMRAIVVEAHSAFCEGGTNCISLSMPEIVDIRRLNAFRGDWLLFLDVKLLSNEALVGALSFFSLWRKTFWAGWRCNCWGAKPGLLCTAHNWMIQGPGDDMATKTIIFSSKNSMCFLGLAAPLFWDYVLSLWYEGGGVDDLKSPLQCRENTMLSSCKLGTEEKGTLLGRTTWHNGTGSL